MQKPFIFVFFHWLPLGIAILFIGGAGYLGIQQNYRASLNDPQIQMVEDAQAALLAGKQPAEIVGRAPLFDAASSLAPFIAIYDESGNPLESSASIGAMPPRPPMGVFEAAKEAGENRVTWQPNAGTRIALVVRPVSIESGWYVAAGRNMREVEARETSLARIFSIALLAALVLTFLLDMVGDKMRRNAMAQMNK